MVLAGPSGVGKSVVITALREKLPQLYFSVSATTRDPRPGEVDGVHYRFVGPAGFDRLLALYELEKLVYELRYEARNRPDWASIPVVGLVRMMETAR